MTEVEWLACDDPLAIVRFLHEKSDRTWRLFVAAWVGDIVKRIPPGHPIHALFGAERYGERLVSAHERFEHRLAMEEAIMAMIRFIFGHGSNGDSHIARGALREYLHEIFGNPFRPATFHPDWRTETALALAQGIYEERTFNRLPILADALQDAGCTTEELLDHLRDTNAPHVRGCWALDRVLGKE